MKSIILAILMAFSVVSFAQADSTATMQKVSGYEYMTVVSKALKGRMSEVSVSSTVEKYRQIVIKRNSQEEKQFDYTTVHELLDQFDKDGWKVVSANFEHVKEKDGNVFYTYYFLKREKKHRIKDFGQLLR